MNEMVERVAKALRDEMAYAELADISINHDRMCQIARAAIAAMRKVTEAIEWAGAKQITPHPDDDFFDKIVHALNAWEAMIDEALR